MRRRHLLALIILALVVATVLAVGPVRVWDWLTTSTVEEYWPSGQMQYRYHLPLWRSVDEWTWVYGLNRGSDFDGWYENGQKWSELRHAPIYRLRGWSKTGEVTTWVVDGMGIQTSKSSAGEVVLQLRYKNGERSETRTSPPWFTEEEILQSVEGVEE